MCSFSPLIRGLVNFFLPWVSWNCHLPDLSLSNSSGWQAWAITPSYCLRWGLKSSLLSCSQTMFLPILASQVSRITSISHRYQDYLFFDVRVLLCSLGWPRICDFLASASRVQGLWATIPIFLLKNYFFIFNRLIFRAVLGFQKNFTAREFPYFLSLSSFLSY
jgi:hypothetical protein